MREKPSLNDRDYATTIASAVFGELVDENDIYVPGILDALTTLGEREEKVLDMRLRQQKTFKEVGICLGVGPERVRQIVHRGIRALRHPSRSRRMRISSILRQLERAEQDFSECWAELAVQRRRAEEYHAMLQASNFRVIIDGSASAEEMETDSSPFIDELGLTLRTYNCLRRAGVNTADELIKFTADDLLHVRNLGKRSALDVAEGMKKAGYVNWAQAVFNKLGLPAPAYQKK